MSTNPHVVVCVGPGGVGKTTTAAALAIAFANEGNRVALVTVDPAKRLADALGLAELTNYPAELSLPRTITGSVAALMLDTSTTFDDLVRKYATSPRQADVILANSFYQNISRALSGTQEYMAMEKLFELATEPVDSSGNSIEGFDVIIVDTPPTKHGLDLIASSDRLIRLLDNKVFRTLMGSSRPGFRLVGNAAQLALKPLGRVIGTDVLADAIRFFQDFEGMEEGFRSRAVSARSLFTGGFSRWILVASPQTATVREASELAHDLRSRGITLRGVIANRVQPLFEPLPSGADQPDRVRAAIERAGQANDLARAQRAALAPLAALAETISYISLRNTDVHTLAQLRTLASQFNEQSSGPKDASALTVTTLLAK